MSEPIDLTPYIVAGSARLTFERDAEAMHRAMNATPLEVKGLREAIAAIAAAPPEPDPMHAMLIEHLNMLAATFDPGGVYGCPVAGCGWRLRVEPPVLTERDLSTLGDPGRLILDYVGARRIDVGARLVLHADGHATNGAPPPVDPPSWADQEWCDEGRTCEHDACLAALDAHLEVDDGDDAP